MRILSAAGISTLAFLFAFASGSPAKALPIEGSFNIEFQEIQPDSTRVWSGMFTSDGSGTVTSFMAEIGDCISQSQCVYAPTFNFVWDGIFLSGQGLGQVREINISLDTWDVNNDGSSIVRRNGTYMVTQKVAVPEPSSLFLMLVGLGALAAGFSLDRRIRRV